MNDEVLASLSHEMRGPLNAILGWAQLLKSGRVAPEEVSRAAEVILRNTRAQARIVDELLDMNSILTGKIRLDLAAADLPVVVADAIKDLRHEIVAKRINFTRSFAGTFPPVAIDSRRIKQVVVNILSNAIKFTPPGGSIGVDLLREDGTACIVVQDSGVGIAPDLLPHVFDGLNAASRRAGRIGLGLSIALHLVQLHGGSISAESAGVGCGATFRVRLPMAGSAADPGPDETDVSLAGVSILAVDDDADTRDLVAHILVVYGAEVTTCTSAREAIDALRQARPTVILCDIGMPDMNGFEFVRRLRADDAGRRTIPTVALTGHSSPDDRREALLAGFDMFVSKPVDPAELVAIIGRCAGRYPPALRRDR